METPPSTPHPPSHPSVQAPHPSLPILRLLQTKITSPTICHRAHRSHCCLVTSQTLAFMSVYILVSSCANTNNQHKLETHLQPVTCTSMELPGIQRLRALGPRRCRVIHQQQVPLGGEKKKEEAEANKLFPSSFNIQKPNAGNSTGATCSCPFITSLKFLLFKASKRHC